MKKDFTHYLIIGTLCFAIGYVVIIICQRFKFENETKVVKEEVQTKDDGLSVSVAIDILKQLDELRARIDKIEQKAFEKETLEDFQMHIEIK